MDKVVVLSEFCKGCGYCVDACPKKVLGLGEKVNAKGYQYAMPVEPENCISCTLCATVCPDAAIEVYQ